MKTLRLLPVLAVLLAFASAFTSAAKEGDEYYTTDGMHFIKKTTNGGCETGGFYCTYLPNTDTPDPDQPLNFDPVGLSQQVWVP